MSVEERVALAREALWPASGAAGFTAYAVLDGARSEAIYPAVTGSGLLYACLYEGKLPEVMLAVEPYLVRLEPEAPLTESLLTESWGESFGVFVLAKASLEELRRHFRRFLKVEDEDGKSLIFRWYDPRVLRVYLPTCNATELRFLFGPAAMFVLEGSEGEVVRFYREGDGLDRTSGSAPALAGRA